MIRWRESDEKRQSLGLLAGAAACSIVINNFRSFYIGAQSTVFPSTRGMSCHFLPQGPTPDSVTNQEQLVFLPDIRQMIKSMQEQMDRVEKGVAEDLSEAA